MDRYGNLQLNVDPDEVAAPRAPRIQAPRGATTCAPPQRADDLPGDRQPARSASSLDSYGMLSVCLGKRSAADELAMPVGTEVTLAAPTDDDAAMSTPVTIDRGRDPMRPGTVLVLGHPRSAIILFAAAAQLFFMR